MNNQFFFRWSVFFFFHFLYCASHLQLCRMHRIQLYANLAHGRIIDTHKKWDEAGGTVARWAAKKDYITPRLCECVCVCCAVYCGSLARMWLCDNNLSKANNEMRDENRTRIHRIVVQMCIFCNFSLNFWVDSRIQYTCFHNKKAFFFVSVCVISPYSRPWTENERCVRLCVSLRWVSSIARPCSCSLLHVAAFEWKTDILLLFFVRRRFINMARMVPFPVVCVQHLRHA